jgi:drug/metabolite transporter (DMT)-like permease
MAFSTAVLWGFLAIGLKVATTQLSVPSIIAFRFVFAAVLLATLLGMSDRSQLKVMRRPPAWALLAGLGLAGNYYGFLQGLHLTNPSTAQVLIQVAPLLLAGAGVWLFQERMRLSQALGAVPAAAGFLLFYLDQQGGAEASAEDPLRGAAWLLFGAVTWAAYGVCQKYEVRRGTSPQQVNLVIYSLCFLLFLPFGTPSDFQGLSGADWLLLCYLGLNTVLAYGCIGEALKRLPAYQVSIIVTLNPLITLVTMAALTFLGVGWLKPERTGALGYFGAALVVVGIVQVLRKPKQRTQDRP